MFVFRCLQLRNWLLMSLKVGCAHSATSENKTASVTNLRHYVFLFWPVYPSTQNGKTELDPFVDDILLWDIVLGSVGSLHGLDLPGMRESEVNVFLTKLLTWNVWEA